MDIASLEKLWPEYRERKTWKAEFVYLLNKLEYKRHKLGNIIVYIFKLEDGYLVLFPEEVDYDSLPELGIDLCNKHDCPVLMWPADKKFISYFDRKAYEKG